MMDMKDIMPRDCDECSGPIKDAHMIDNYDSIFCSRSCAEQAVINYNVDYAERKADEKRYE